MKYPGIDFEVGISRLSNQDVYLNCLQKFAESYEKAGNIIGAAINHENFEEAKNLNHKLKGVAGNLSLPNVFAQTKRLEKCLLAGEPANTEADHLKLTIEEVCLSIALLIKETSK